MAETEASRIAAQTTIAVPRLTIAQHERIDPFSELAERVHPDKIIRVEI